MFTSNSSIVTSPSTSRAGAKLEWIRHVASASRWRQNSQLSGLQAFHPNVVAQSVRIANPGTIMAGACLALHPSEEALAVVLSPLGAAPSVGLIPLVSSSGSGSTSSSGSTSASLDYVTTAAWLDLPLPTGLTSGDASGTRASAAGLVASVAWNDDLLLLGCDRGRIVVGEYHSDAAWSSSGAFEEVGVLRADPSELALHQRTCSPSLPVPSTTVRCLQSAGDSREKVLGAFGVEAVVFDLAGADEPIYRFRPSCPPIEDVATSVGWMPQSQAQVLVVGTLGGVSCLVDRRCDESGKPSAWLTPPPSSLRRAGGGGGGGGGARGTAASAAVPQLAYDTARGVTALCTNAFFSNLLCMAFSDGYMALYDLRFAQAPVQSWDSGQGCATSMAWLPTHPDTLVSSGIDGTVRWWNLRALPTLCIGRCKYLMPVSQMETTSRFVAPRCIGVTIDGSLELSGLQASAWADAAPTSVPSSAASGGGRSEVVHGKSTHDDAAAAAGTIDEEGFRNLLRHVYTRSLAELYAAVTEFVEAALARRNHALAAEALDLLAVALPQTSFSIDAQLALFRSVQQNQPHAPTSAAALGVSTQRLHSDFDIVASRLSSVVAVHELRGVALPLDSVKSRLEALRGHVAMQQAIAEKSVVCLTKLLKAQAAAIKSSPSVVELTHTETLCDAVQFVVTASLSVSDGGGAGNSGGSGRQGAVVVSPGTAVFGELLSALVNADGSSPSRPLVRRLLTTVLTPLVTDSFGGVESKSRQPHGGSRVHETAHRKKKFLDKCLKSLPQAQRAAIAQLTVQQLGVLQPQRVLEFVREYHRKEIEGGGLGIFCWISAKAILLYLNSLCQPPETSLSAFLWTSVQLVDHYHDFDVAREIEVLLFNVLERLRTGAQATRDALTKWLDGARRKSGAADVAKRPSTTTALAAPALPQRRPSSVKHGDDDSDDDEDDDDDHGSLEVLLDHLTNTHAVVKSLLTIQLGCESILEEANLSDAPPPLLKSCTDLLNNVTTDLLESWADVLEFIQESYSDATRAKDVRDAGVVARVEAFAKEVDPLFDVSPRGEDDDTLNDIVGVCGDFSSRFSTSLRTRGATGNSAKK